VGGKGESRERGLQLYLLAFIFGFWFFFVPLFHISERYLLAGFLPAFIWIGRGFILLKSQLEERLSRPAKSRLSFLPPGKGALLVLILIWGVLVFLPELGRVVKRDKWSSGIFDDAVELKQAGEWIRENGKKNPVLMTQMKSVDFYAGVFDVRKGVSFSEDNLERNLAYARCRRVDYLVVTSRYSERYPQLEPLFEKDNPLPELKLVHAERTPQDIEMRIFVLLK